MSTPSSLDLTLPSLRIHALVAGPEQGPLVVLLHGIPESSESWREVMLRLSARGFRVVAPDLRGYGATDKPSEGYDLGTLAGDIRDLVRHLRPGRPAHVVGHDIGGGVAFHLAAWHPEVVDRLVVINSPHPLAMMLRMWRPAHLLRSWYILFFQLPRLPEALLSARQGALIEFLLRRAIVNPETRRDERVARYAASFAEPGVAHATVSIYRAFMRSILTPSRRRRLRESYPRIRAPFRLVWAEQDVFLMREMTYSLDPYFEHPPEVRYLPGVGHFAPMEAPEAVSELILEHLHERL